MLNPLTKLATIQSDGRIVDLVKSLEPGRRPTFVAQIQKWYPKTSRATILFGIKILRGTAPQTNPIGRPRKHPRIDVVASECLPVCSSEATADNGIAEPSKRNVAAPRKPRYEIVERINRRTGSTLYGFWDTRFESETLVGTYREALEEIERRQKIDIPLTVAFHRNGKPVVVCNADIENDEDGPDKPAETRTSNGEDLRRSTGRPQRKGSSACNLRASRSHEELLRHTQRQL